MSATVKDGNGQIFTKRHGLEGPFRYKGGRVLYFDRSEGGGTYYDPTTDLYLTIAQVQNVIGFVK